jgi:hypothetical protein
MTYAVVVESPLFVSNTFSFTSGVERCVMQERFRLLCFLSQFLSCSERFGALLGKYNLLYNVVRVRDT